MLGDIPLGAMRTLVFDADGLATAAGEGVQVRHIQNRGGQRVARFVSQDAARDWIAGSLTPTNCVCPSTPARRF